MSFIKRYLKYILLANIVLLVIIFVVNRNLPTPNEINKMAFESIKLTKFEGLVIDKFMDKKNHNHATIKLKNSFGEQNIILTRDKSEIFDFIQVGDSISKEYGDLNVYIERGSELYEIKLDYKIK
jgi:hypothetical protein